MLNWRSKLRAMSLCFLAAGAVGQRTEPADQLDQRLSAMTSLQGEFTQTLHDVDGTLLEESEGHFALQRPGKFYWHTREPFEQLLVSDREHIWLYDPGLEQVTVRDYDEEVQGSPATILSGDPDTLESNFFVEHSADNGKDRFILTPRSDDDMFQRLTLLFDGQQLVELSMRDSLEQITRFRFNDVSKNEPIDPSLFEFEPPEGVDVLVD